MDNQEMSNGLISNDEMEKLILAAVAGGKGEPVPEETIRKIVEAYYDHKVAVACWKLVFDGSLLVSFDEKENEVAFEKQVTATTPALSHSEPVEPSSEPSPPGQ